MNQSMQSRVRAYIELRRSLGYKLRVEAGMLFNFARYADASRHRGALTRELALRWAALPPRADRLYYARRLEVVRVFARHQAAVEPATRSRRGMSSARLIVASLHISIAPQTSVICLAAHQSFPDACARLPIEPSSLCWPARDCASRKHWLLNCAMSI